MAINSFDPGYISAAKQVINYVKTASRTTAAGIWTSVHDLGGNPGAGALAGTNTANGIVPDDTLAGYTPINAFAAGATGYLTQVDFGNSVASRMRLFATAFIAGAYPYNASVTLASQPSYAAKTPNLDYTVYQLWFETVTSFTGNVVITVTYTNQAGVTGRSTGAFNPGFAPVQGRMFQIPLQVGDTGIQKIESVTCTTATAGTFNLLVIRPLWNGRVRINNDGGTHNIYDTQMPIVYPNSALRLMVAPDGTSTGIPELQFVVASG